MNSEIPEADRRVTDMLNLKKNLNYHHNNDPPYLQAFDNAPVPVTILREDGRFMLINRTAQTSLGYTSKEIPTLADWVTKLEGDDHDADDANAGHHAVGIEQRLFRLFTPETAFTQIRTTLTAKNGRILTWEIYNAPLGHAPDGERLLLRMATDVTYAKGQPHRCSTSADRLEHEVAVKTTDFQQTIDALENEISERKCMEEALKLSRERLKHMSMKILNALEADRKTVSKELHDSIGASLAAIKFSLEEKELNREKNRGRQPDSLSQEIAYLLSTIKETKRISAELRPSTLDDLGLMATIKWYLRQFRQAYKNIHVRFTTDLLEDDVPDAMKIILYRIIQEGLGNAEKHSGADNVRLHLGMSDGNRTVSLVIEDDGDGFDVGEVISRKDPTSGYGLIAMRERCEIFGGSFHINSRVGRGTKIHAMLPL